MRGMIVSQVNIIILLLWVVGNAHPFRVGEDNGVVTTMAWRVPIAFSPSIPYDRRLDKRIRTMPATTKTTVTTNVTRDSLKVSLNNYPSSKEILRTPPLTPPQNKEDQHYWKLHAQRRQYEHDNKILYVKSALSPFEFASISTELSSLMIDGTTTNTNRIILHEEDSSFATKRLGACVPPTSNTYNILQNGSISRLINELYNTITSAEEKENNKMILAPNIPVEVRRYEFVGSGMEWHVDDILYCPRQVEIVLTLENTSDCVTMWKSPMKKKKEKEDRTTTPITTEDESGKNEGSSRNRSTHPRKDETYTVHSIQTVPNSILILESGGVEHKVTPLSYGKRTILKMAFMSKHAVMDKSMERHASHHRKNASTTSTRTRALKTTRDCHDNNNDRKKWRRRRKS